MKTFPSLEEAFVWWLNEIYPSLPADVKVGKYVNAWRDYRFKKGISRKRMNDVLSDFAEVEEKTIVTIKLK